MLNDLTLRRLANKGLTDLPDLRRIIRSCYQKGEQEGLASYGILAQALEMIDREWDDQAIPVEGSERINELLAEHLPAMFDAASPKEASDIAVRLREEIRNEIGTW